jgi:hypothetical protein
MEVHRGRCGANLKTPRAGRLGFWRTCGNSDFDTPRCREASRPAGPLRPLASRAPSVLFGRAVECRMPDKPGVRETMAYPAPQRTGAMARARSTTGVMRGLDPRIHAERGNRKCSIVVAGPLHGLPGQARQ